MRSKRKSSRDAQPPSAPSGLSLSGTSASGLTLSWNASADNLGVAGYDLYLIGSKIGTTAATSYGFGGLSCGQSYTLGVDAYDAAGNRSPQASVQASSSPCPDTQAPTTPQLLVETSATASGISLSWQPSLDNVAVAGYTVYTNGTKAGTTGLTLYSVSNLACGQSYALAVDAYDAAGNHSPQTSVVASTAPCMVSSAASDTQPPSAPSGLSLSGTSASGLTLSWNASADNLGIAGYNLYLNGSKIGTTAATSYGFGGLSCGQSYTLGVDAYDAAGNRSLQSSVTAATSSCTLLSQAGATYYVSTSGGSDSNDGRTPSTPWRSLAKVNTVAFAPGDTVRFAAGDVFAGLLSVSASGTGAAPITLSSYGSGAQPVFTDPSQPSSGDCIDVKGSYVVVDGLHVDACRYGLRLFGQHDEVRNSTFTHNAEGLRTEAGADYASVHGNSFSDNNVMVVNTPCSVNCNDDYGADAVLIAGNNGDFAHNTVSGTWTTSYDYGHDGSAFEVFGGSGNTFEYNLARDNENFIEFGCRCSTRPADNNKVNFNVITSTLGFGVTGIEAHGNESFGPTNGTTVYNNSIYLSSPSSEALRCGACSAVMMRLRNNAARMTGSGSGFNLSGADEDYDILNGALWGGSTLGPHSRSVDPLFVSATNLDTQTGSPARGAGTLLLGLTSDFVGTPIPDGGLTDIGAYQH